MRMISGHESPVPYPDATPRPQTPLVAGDPRMPLSAKRSCLVAEGRADRLVSSIGPAVVMLVSGIESTGVTGKAVQTSCRFAGATI